MEDLNKYLSRLSEHHDMYVFLLLGIGMVCSLLSGRRSDPVDRAYFVRRLQCDFITASIFVHVFEIIHPMIPRVETSGYGQRSMITGDSTTYDRGIRVR